MSQVEIENSSLQPRGKRGKRLVFVGGAPRSGTTLVQNILDSHPDICGIPEFFYLRDIMKLRATLRTAIDRGWIDLICSYEDLDRRLCSFIEDLLLRVGDDNGAKLVSEKSPTNVLISSELLSVCPDARFIHVVRDPRAIIGSLLRVGFRIKQKKAEAKAKGLWPAPVYTKNVISAISYVAQCHSAGMNAAAAYPDRVLTVLYERVVTDPEGESRRMCDFLELEWCRDMLFPGQKKHLGEKAIVNDIWYDADSYYRNPETREIEKWRKELSPTQQVIISRHFTGHEELARLGYNFSLDQFSATHRIMGSAQAALGNMREKMQRELVSNTRNVPGVAKVIRPVVNVLRTR